MEPRSNIFNHRPPLDSVWRCPCGTELAWLQMLGHRRGYKKRPQCTGKIRPVDASLLYDELVDRESPMTDIIPAEGCTVREAASRLGISEKAVRHRVLRGTLPTMDKPDGRVMVDMATYLAKKGAEEITIIEPEPSVIDDDPVEDETDDSDTDDPEELARRFNSRRGLDLGGVTLLTREQMGIDDPPPTLPPGDWTAETGAGPLAVSQDRLAITLPVQVRIMYDWAISQGWHVGDGSLSAFVTDIIFDHFQACWGMGIFVAPLEEVDNAERGPSESRPAGTGRGADLASVGKRTPGS